jgi:hypothetical protein
MRYAFFLLPLLGGLSSYALPLTRTRTAPPLARAAEPVQMRSCQGGIEYPLDIELTPTSISSVSGVPGESVELTLNINNRLGAGVRMVHSIEVRDDHGNKVAPAVVSAVSELAVASKGAFKIRVPKLASDGFFVAQVSVAAKTPAGASDERTAETYWQVTGGKLVQLDYADWLAQSDARKAVKL